jgi:small subunit ribosomal protein S4
VDRDQLTATLVREPARREVPLVRDEQLVVESYSR